MNIRDRTATWLLALKSGLGQLRAQMVQLLPYGLRIRILQHDREAISKWYDRQARLENDPEAREALFVDGYWRRSDLNDEIGLLQTRILIEAAERHFVPWPRYQDNPDAWERCESSEHMRLTQHAAHDLLSALRQERKDRSEVFRLWLAGLGPMLTAVTGLIGAIIGLTAILLR
jgi:hypothetical protein